MARPLAPLTLTDDERSELRGWARRPTTAQSHALRARIILCSADGLSNEEVADELGVSSVTVGKWRKRFIKMGLSRLSKTVESVGSTTLCRGE